MSLMAMAHVREHIPLVCLVSILRRKIVSTGWNCFVMAGRLGERHMGETGKPNVERWRWQWMESVYSKTRSIQQCWQICCHIFILPLQPYPTIPLPFRVSPKISYIFYGLLWLLQSSYVPQLNLHHHWYTHIRHISCNCNCVLMWNVVFVRCSQEKLRSPLASCNASSHLNLRIPIPSPSFFLLLCCCCFVFIRLTRMLVVRAARGRAFTSANIR